MLRQDQRVLGSQRWNVMYDAYQLLELSVECANCGQPSAVADPLTSLLAIRKGLWRELGIGKNRWACDSHRRWR
jgi:hypothetical protein